MITGMINSEVTSRNDMFEGAKFSVDVFNDNSKVKIQVGNQEVLIGKELFLEVSSMVKDARLGGKKIPIEINCGEF